MLQNEAEGPRRNDPRVLASLRLVVFLNVAFFCIELVAALAIGSVSLVADSVDFLEDTAVNSLVLAGLRFSPVGRARLAMVLAALLVLPAMAGLVMLIHKIVAPTPPAPLLLSLMGFVALIVNSGCAAILLRIRGHAGSLTRAAFLSARNDTLANIAIIAAGAVTAFWPTIWPDIVVGIGIALLNAGSAREIFKAAKVEHRDARAE